MDLKSFIERISNSPGISGCEQEVAGEIALAWEQIADEVRRDNLGNVIALKKGKNSNKPPLMLAAHQDEIGFLVRDIDKDGFISLDPIGGIDPRLLPGQEIKIWGREEILGVVGARPPHLQKPQDREKAIPLEKIFVDCGLKKEELEKKIRIGDAVTFHQKMGWLNENIGYGKALDDRAGVAALHQVLLELKDRPTPLDVAVVATVQEEVGIRGAITSSFALNPDLGLAVDVAFASRPGLEKEMTLNSNGGPGLEIGPHMHPGVLEKLKEVAGEKEIPIQLIGVPHPGGTDTYIMQMNRCGMATGLLSIPLANMHSPVEVIDIRDVRRTGRLMANFCLQADVEFVEGLKCL